MAGQPLKAICFGEILWDVIGAQEHLGGAPMNLSAHLARCGARAMMVSAVGDDDRGRRALAAMRELDVDCRFVEVLSGRPTGWVDVALSAGGQPSYTIHEGVAWDSISLSTVQLAQLAGEEASAICFGTLSQRTAANRETLFSLLAAVKARHVFYDVNLRQHYFTREIVERSLEHSTIVKLNDAEARCLSTLLLGKVYSERDFAAAIARQYELEAVVITRGEHGCGVLHGDKWHECPGVPVRVADAVGAGDAFGAAFLARYCSGARVLAAATVANRLGAFVASRPGAIPPYTDEMQKLLRR